MQFSRRALLLGTVTAHRRGLRAADSLTPAMVHRELVQGHDRFVHDKPRHPHSSLRWVKKTGREGQHPHAAVLCCSDSRVIPEIVFDQGIGDLFTVRVAGNVANEDELASIGYAIKHFEVPLTVVLGHSRCGAITAVVEGEELPEALSHLAIPIREAYAAEKARRPAATAEQLIAATIHANVLRTVARIAAEPEVKHAIELGRHQVEGAVYDLENGRIAWLSAPAAATEPLR